MVWLILNTLKINSCNMLRNTVTQLRNVTQGDIYIVPCYGNCYGNVLPDSGLKIITNRGELI
jgi:hypothetical protein